LKTIINIITMIVCVCRGVTDRELARAIGQGCRSLDDVARCTGAGTGCGTCHASIKERLEHRPTALRMLPLVAVFAETT
jgi:bacterioferritin-associated ferredoxin